MWWSWCSGGSAWAGFLTHPSFLDRAQNQLPIKSNQSIHWRRDNNKGNMKGSRGGWAPSWGEMCQDGRLRRTLKRRILWSIGSKTPEKCQILSLLPLKRTIPLISQLWARCWSELRSWRRGSLFLKTPPHPQPSSGGSSPLWGRIRPISPPLQSPPHPPWPAFVGLEGWCLQARGGRRELYKQLLPSSSKSPGWKVWGTGGTRCGTAFGSTGTSRRRLREGGWGLNRVHSHPSTW